MTRVIGPRKSPRRRWTFLTSLVVAVALGVLFIPGALAIHDDGFQLDGDVSHACPSPAGLCTSTQKDWADLFTVGGSSGTQTVTTNGSVVGAAGSQFTNATFNRDFQSGSSCALNAASGPFCTGDDTTYATGSKDTLEINTGWACNHDNNVNSKIDIMNSYAVVSKDPTTNDKVMFFGLEKNKDNGTNDVGFWFLQGGASCPTPTSLNPHPNWTGTHTPGDVLVVSEYTNGGGVSNITAYRWVGGANPLTQIATATGTGGDCKTALGGDALCATTNSGAKQFTGNITTPWLSADATLGVGHTVVPPDFFEGGIDLTRAFQQSGATVPSCFDTFIADTRSSTSLTATLFDYTRGQIGSCATTLSTQENQTSGVSIGGGSVSSGTDTATLNINGTSTWGGTLTFYLCGPVSTDGCDNTGVLVTSTAVSSADNTTTYNSGTATLTSAGRYCWHAHFAPNPATSNAGVSAQDDNGANECFTVAKASPTVTTHAGTSPVSLGTAITDTADVSGLAKEPGSNGAVAKYPTINATNGAFAGTLTFTLKGPADSGCGITATGTGTNPQSITNLSAGNTTYGPVSFTPNNAGKFHWQATLSNASSVNNTLPYTDNSACDQSREDVTVLQHPTTELTNPVDGSGVTVTTVLKGASVYDHAVVTDSDAGGGSPTGTVSFWVCNPSQISGLAGSEVCADGAGDSVQANVALTAGPGADQSQATTTTAVVANAVGIWCFRSVYTPDTSLFLSSFDHSHLECFNVVDVTIATAQTFTVKDTATVTPSGPGASVGGNVRFRLYPNDTCGGTALVDETVAVSQSTSAQQVSTTPATITATPGNTNPNLSWLVEYTHGTGTAKDVTSSCSTEHATLTIANG